MVCEALKVVSSFRYNICIMYLVTVKLGYFVMFGKCVFIVLYFV